MENLNKDINILLKKKTNFGKSLQIAKIMMNDKFGEDGGTSDELMGKIEDELDIAIERMKSVRHEIATDTANRIITLLEEEQE